MKIKRTIRGNAYTRMLRADTVPPGGDPPQPLTEARVAELVQKALGSYKPKEFETFSTQLGGITETLKGLVKPPESPAPGVKPEENAVILALRKQLEGVTSKQSEWEKKAEASEKRAEEVDKESKIRAVLGGFKFFDDGAAEDAYQLIAGQITRDENGNLINKSDNLPLADFVKSYIPGKKGYLLAPEKAGGAGAQRGAPRLGNTKFDTDQIKVGMSTEELKQAIGAIRAALPQV